MTETNAKFPPRCLLDATELMITGDAPAYKYLPCEKQPWRDQQDIDYISVAESEHLRSQAVADLEARLKRADLVIERMIAMAGNPDAAAGCRNLIGVGKAYFDERKTVADKVE